MQQIAAAGVTGAGSQVAWLNEIADRLAADFDGVQVHAGTPQARTACQRLQAEAYTYGNAMAFFEPRPSRRTVAHEAAHVVQQRRGEVRGGSGSAAGAFDAPDTALERDAEVVADAVVEGRSLPRRASGDSTVEHPVVQRKAARQQHLDIDSLARGDTPCDALNAELEQGPVYIVDRERGVLLLLFALSEYTTDPAVASQLVAETFYDTFAPDTPDAIRAEAAAYLAATLRPQPLEHAQRLGHFGLSLSSETVTRLRHAANQADATPARAEDVGHPTDPGDADGADAIPTPPTDPRPGEGARGSMPAHGPGERVGAQSEGRQPQSPRRDGQTHAAPTDSLLDVMTGGARRRFIERVAVLFGQHLYATQFVTIDAEAWAQVVQQHEGFFRDVAQRATGEPGVWPDTAALESLALTSGELEQLSRLYSRALRTYQQLRRVQGVVDAIGARLPFGSTHLLMPGELPADLAAALPPGLLWPSSRDVWEEFPLEPWVEHDHGFLESTDLSRPLATRVQALVFGRMARFATAVARRDGADDGRIDADNEEETSGRRGPRAVAHRPGSGRKKVRLVVELDCVPRQSGEWVFADDAQLTFAAHLSQRSPMAAFGPPDWDWQLQEQGVDGNWATLDHSVDADATWQTGGRGFGTATLRSHGQRELLPQPIEWAQGVTDALGLTTTSPALDVAARDGLDETASRDAVTYRIRVDAELSHLQFDGHGHASHEFRVVPSDEVARSEFDQRFVGGSSYTDGDLARLFYRDDEGRLRVRERITDPNGLEQQLETALELIEALNDVRPSGELTGERLENARRYWLSERDRLARIVEDYSDEALLAAGRHRYVTRAFFASDAERSAAGLQPLNWLLYAEPSAPTSQSRTGSHVHSTLELLDLSQPLPRGKHYRGQGMGQEDLSRPGVGRARAELDALDELFHALVDDHEYGVGHIHLAVETRYNGVIERTLALNSVVDTVLAAIKATGPTLSAVLLVLGLFPPLKVPVTLLSAAISLLTGGAALKDALEQGKTGREVLVPCTTIATALFGLGSMARVQAARSAASQLSNEVVTSALEHRLALYDLGVHATNGIVAVGLDTINKLDQIEMTLTMTLARHADDESARRAAVDGFAAAYDSILRNAVSNGLLFVVQSGRKVNGIRDQMTQPDADTPTE